MGHCEEPDEAGVCTNCGKCGKGRENFPGDKARDNHLTRRDVLRFRSFTSQTTIPGKRLPVLSNTVVPMSSGPEPADSGTGAEIRDRD